MNDSPRKQQKRGRPTETPLTDSERLAITVLVYGLEVQFRKDGLLDSSIFHPNFSKWEELRSGIIKRLKSQCNRVDSNLDLEQLGQIDFFKNLLKIAKGSNETCKRPMIKNLDILVQYTFSSIGIGWKWSDYKAIFDRESVPELTQSFFNPSSVNVSTLEIGQEIVIGWIPQHFYLLEYLGNYGFKVLVAGDGMLHSKGDEFFAESFLISYPKTKLTYKTQDGEDRTIEYPSYKLPELSYIPHIFENL